MEEKAQEKNEAESKNTDKIKIIFFGLLVHILILFSVLDVYFSNPLHPGIYSVKSTTNPPAKRLIIFAADGFATKDIFKRENKAVTPFLTNIKYHVGSWGEIHKPDVVAMLAGFYEDYFRGWYPNSIDFDSVINQSTNTWAWGHPDIIKIFNRNNLSKIHTYSYSNDDDITSIFKKVEIFLNTEVGECRVDCNQYFNYGNIFFLHIPTKLQSKNDILLVDEKIKKTVDNFNTVFPYNSNIFMLTSKTNILAWGAGIKKSSKQIDIHQNDLTPLIAALIGINIPVHSLGVLPVKYIDVKCKDLTEMILANVMEVMELFKTKMLQVEKYTSVYLPYKNITRNNLEMKITELESLSLTDLIEEREKFITFLKDGIKYYNNYYKYPVLLAVSLGFLIWISFLCLYIFGLTNRTFKAMHRNFILTSCFLIVTTLCRKNRFTAMYYVYFHFPLLSFFVFLRQLDFLSIIPEIVNLSFAQVASFGIGVELLIYGFFNKTALTVIMISIGLWVYISNSLRRYSTGANRITWLICCLTISVFPSLPKMINTFNLTSYLVSHFVYMQIFWKIYVVDLKYYQKLKNVYLQYQTLFAQFFLLQFAVTFIILIEYDYIPSDLKYLSWIIFLLPLLLIPISENFIALRFASLIFGFAPFYFLVSTNYEVLFLAFYVITLYVWLNIESKTFGPEVSPKIIYYSKFEDNKIKNEINSESFRRSFFFFVFILIGIFGTNFNTFDPVWVSKNFNDCTCPYKMLGLVAVKFIVPLIFACSIFRAINKMGKQNIFKIFCILMLFSDLIVLQFLFLIKHEEGIGLDAGSNVFQFIFMNGFVIILLVIYTVASWLTNIRYKYFIVI